MLDEHASEGREDVAGYENEGKDEGDEGEEGKQPELPTLTAASQSQVATRLREGTGHA